MSPRETPSQTAGPYVHIGCTPNAAGITTVFPCDLGSKMILGDVQGERIILTGRIFDGAGAVLTDALVEIWQADADGLYPSPLEPRGAADARFTGWGRAASDPVHGTFRFETIKPGPVPGPDGTLQAPHITVWIVARGINLGLQTRAYFADESAANAADPLLRQAGARATTLLATPAGDGVYTFDIHLQGPGETVFLNI